MSASDVHAYRSCYCESCHQLRKDFGIVSTTAVNYDMTFNGIMMNALSSSGIKEQNTKNGMICIFGKAVDSGLLRKIAGHTILLTKWELEDDKHDRPTLRSNAASIALGRAIRKAETMYPEYDEHAAKGFDDLKRMEAEQCGDPVLIGRRFAMSLMPSMEDIAGDAWSDHLKDLFTGLGTAVYVMDAADDLDEDFMNGTFNPFLVGYEDYINKNEFMQKNVYQITDKVSEAMKDIRNSYSFIRDSMHFHHGIADNIIFRGLPESAKRIISCECSSRPGLRNTISSRVLRRGK